MNRLFTIIYLFGILAVMPNLEAEERIDSVFVSDFNASVGDLSYVGNQILHASRESLLNAGIVLGTSILAMPLDEEMRTISQRNKSTLDGSLLSFANGYGELLYPALGTVGIYGLGLGFEDERMRFFSRKTFTSLMVAGVMTTAIKSIVGRSRPFMNEGSQTYTPFNVHDARLSFPSGHTTIAFAMSASLSKLIDRWWADVLLYSLATGTAYARMHNDRHWLSDTILGGAIGYFATQWVYDTDENTITSSSKTSFIPIISPFSLGIIVQY